jgi:hypothetical protein
MSVGDEKTAAHNTGKESQDGKQRNQNSKWLDISARP